MSMHGINNLIYTLVCIGLHLNELGCIRVRLMVTLLSGKNIPNSWTLIINYPVFMQVVDVG